MRGSGKVAKSYEEIAKEVVEAVGGKENIASFAHCATRLRIMVNDESKIVAYNSVNCIFYV